MAPHDIPAHRTSAIGARLANFWRWWRGEIVRMLPQRFAAFGGGGSTPLVSIEGDDVVVIDPHAPAGSEKRASVAGLDNNARRAHVRALLEAAGETRGRARAALRHDEALVRRVVLPAATEENLSHVLGFEMDRLTPFKADEVYFDQRVASRDAANGQIAVDLAMARRQIVDARVRELGALGVSVQGVALRDDAHRSPDTFDLLPSEQRGERESPRERMVRMSLVGAVALLFLGALAYPVYSKREAVKALQPALEKARADAQATDAVLRELERQAADYNFLLTRKYSWYPTAQYIEDLSRLLPDTTWLQQLDIKTTGKTKEIVITGETASSSKLIELLESSKLLQNASPRGPTTRGSVPGTERFMIGAELRPRTLPEAQAVAVSASAATPPPANAAAPVPAAAAPAPAPAAPGAPANAPQGANAVAPSTATVTPVPKKAAPPNNGFGPFPKQ
jgi:general secretion pathway protein L